MSNATKYMRSVLFDYWEQERDPFGIHVREGYHPATLPALIRRGWLTDSHRTTEAGRIALGVQK